MYGDTKKKKIEDKIPEAEVVEDNTKNKEESEEK